MLATQERLLEARGLELRHGERVVVEQLSISVDAGETVALVGRNGVGKTTLLRALAGLHPPTAGSIHLRGVSVRPGSVAFVPQRDTLNLAMPMTVRRLVTTGLFGERGLVRPVRARDRALVDETLELLGLAGLAERSVHELSAGQRQRALVARGAVHARELLVADEPFTAVDTDSSRRIIDLFEHEARQGRSVLFTTHDRQQAQRSDRILLLTDVSTHGRASLI